MGTARKIWAGAFLPLAVASCTGLIPIVVGNEGPGQRGRDTEAPAGSTGAPSPGAPLAVEKHPLVVKRHVRIEDVALGTDGLWHSRWLDLSDGLASSSAFEVKASVKCTILNAGDYLLGKPGSKACSAGIVSRNAAKFSPAGYGGFDDFKEAWLAPWGDARSPSATGDLILVRFGDPGPEAHYAKVMIVSADTTFVEMSWAFQTKSGVRILDPATSTESYRQDPTPTPTPTVPAPTKRPRDPAIAKKALVLSWRKFFYAGRTYQETDWLSLSDGTTMNSPAGVAIQFQRRVQDEIDPGDPSFSDEHEPVLWTMGTSGVIAGRKRLALAFQEVCGAESRPETFDAPEFNWNLLVSPSNFYFYDRVFERLPKCELLFRSDGPRYGKLAIDSAPAPESGKKTPPVKLELWIQPATGSTFLE